MTVFRRKVRGKRARSWSVEFRFRGKLYRQGGFISADLAKQWQTQTLAKLGPLVFAKAGWKRLSFTWETHGGDESAGNAITVYAFGYIAALLLPTIIPPRRTKHIAESWDAATVARMGRNWYYSITPREYGFSLSDGYLNLYYGVQTHDSSSEQRWGYVLPWTQWRFVRHSLYGLNGEHVYTEPYDRDFQSMWDAVQACPKVSFIFDDYDGTRITATTHIEEREWKFGTGWFRWLSWFRKPKVCRSLDIRFSEEVGKDKGSWKGGTVGHGIDMLPGELHEAAFRRYCEKEHSAKDGRYRVTFVGVAGAA